MIEIFENTYYYSKDSDTPVHLFTTPPKKILNSKASLIDENCFPSAILHFAQEKKETAYNEVRKNTFSLR